METNKGKNLILVILFILLLINITILISFFVFPAKQKDPDVFKKEWLGCKKHHDKQCILDLDLEEAQKHEFFKLKKKYKKTVKNLIDSTRQERKHLFSTIEQEDKSAEELYNYAEDIGKIHAEIEKETINFFIEMKKILNKNQFSEFLSKFKKKVCGFYHKDCSHKHKFIKKKKYMKHKNLCPYDDVDSKEKVIKSE